MSGLVAACIALAVLASGASAEQGGSPDDGASTTAKPSAVSGSTLSSRLQILTKSSIAAATAAEQAEAISVAQNGPGSLLRQGKRPIVNVRFEAIKRASTAALEEAGAKILLVSRRYQIITVAAAIEDLREIGEVDGVISVLEEHTPMIARPDGSAPTGGAAPNRTTCVGARTSEGDGQLNADQARNTFNVTGAGVKVGMISDSYDKAAGAETSAADDVASGDLPGQGNPCGLTTPVQVLADNSVNSQTDEGRAQGQIIHDLAPGADLAFATGFTGHLQMAQAIRNLAAAGAHVIVDDVIYFDEPMFQDGPIAEAINDVTADGVSYFTAVGNNNIVRSGKNVGSYEAPAFREATACPPGLPPYAVECMNFSTSGQDSTYGINVPAGETVNIVLGWSQPWFGVTTDYDVYLRQGDSLIADDTPGPPGPVSENNNPLNGIPQERVEWENNTGSTQTVTLSISRCSETCNPDADSSSPRLKLIFQQNSGQGVYPTEYQDSMGGDIVGPTAYGHFAALNAVSVGATRYNSFTTVEDFSSRGPATLFWEPVTGGGPAPALPSPVVLNKPDVTATDCGANTFFGVFDAGIWRFCGTSASSPHAAAVAALILDGNPGASVAQVKDAERSTARPVGSLPATAVGHGLIDALAAVAYLPPEVTISDVSRLEGNSGTPAITFTARLSKPSTEPTSLKFSTANGTATANNDFVPVTNQLLTIPAGTVNKTFTVLLKGELLVEPNETFRVILSQPLGLKLVDARSDATILNDDFPSATINDVSRLEGDSGTPTMTFTVHLSEPSPQPAALKYSTEDGSATSNDYIAQTNKTLSFPAGTVNKTLSVRIRGDLLVEPNEKFRVNLSQAVGLRFADARGEGTILNDDP